jgi:hypothetical protein
VRFAVFVLVRLNVSYDLIRSVIVSFCCCVIRLTRLVASYRASAGYGPSGPDEEQDLVPTIAPATASVISLYCHRFSSDMLLPMPLIKSRSRNSVKNPTVNDCKVGKSMRFIGKSFATLFDLFVASIHVGRDSAMV